MFALPMTLDFVQRQGGVFPHLSPFENLKEASKHPRCFVFVRTRTVQELSRAKMQDA